MPSNLNFSDYSRVSEASSLEIDKKRLIRGMVRKNFISRNDRQDAAKTAKAYDHFLNVAIPSVDVQELPHPAEVPQDHLIKVEDQAAVEAESPVWQLKRAM